MSLSMSLKISCGGTWTVVHWLGFLYFSCYAILCLKFAFDFIQITWFRHFFTWTCISSALSSPLTAQSSLQHLSCSPIRTHIYTQMAEAVSSVWRALRHAAGGASDLPVTRQLLLQPPHYELSVRGNDCFTVIVEQIRKKDWIHGLLLYCCCSRLNVFAHLCPIKTL